MDEPSSLPRTGDAGRRARRTLVATALALACFAAALGLRLASAGREGPDRWPRPDAIEYAEVAASLARGDGYAYPLLGVAMPPRYPPGAPLALLPATLWRGARDAWIAAAVWSALAVVLAAAFGQLVGGGWAALGAGAVALLLPLSVEFAGFAMSEGPVQGLVGALLVAAALASRRRARGRTRAIALAVASVAMAWLALVRLPLVAFALPLLAAALVPGRAEGESRAPLSARVVVAAHALVPLALAFVALALLQHALFGDATTTGYHFWVPIEYVHFAEYVVSTRWLTETWPMPWDIPHAEAYALALAGRAPGGVGQVLWSTPTALLAVVGAASVVRRARSCPVARVTVAAGISCAALVGFHALYFWQDTRFFAPLVVVVGACAGQGLALAVRAVGARFREPSARAAAQGASALALLALALVGPTRSIVERARWIAAQPPGIVASAEALAPHVPRGALLVVDCSSPLAREVFGADVELAFTELVSADGHLEYVRTFGLVNARGEAPRATALSVLEVPDEDGLAHVRAALAAGRDVFVFLSHHEGAPGVGLARLRDEGVRFEPVATHGIAELFRLAPPR